MGQITLPDPVKLIVAMLSGDEALFEHAAEAMQELWGPIDVQSNIMAFEQTQYYQKEMGPALRRKFVGFAELIDPAALARIKHQTNVLEAKYAADPIGKALGVARPINLDPGYIEPSKLVLATTKNYSHRIYIGESIYAEATLRYHKGHWQSWPFTYPDYAGGQYDDFLNQTRQRLLEQKQSPKQNTC